MHAQDHRALGNRLDLFHQQQEGPGMVFWHPRGVALWRVIEDHIRRRMRRAGYREVRTPQILARSLWERSGHWEKFGEDMFALEVEGRALAVKPMSCPCHIQIFNKRVRSFRDLPMRYFEFGAVHRSEPSGALHGLFRTRGFVQDDAHVFCREDQVEAEVRRFCRIQTALYADFGFDEVEVRFSTRPEVRAGSDDVWDRAERSLEAAARAAGLDPILQPGEGAFYGPKLEFHLKDRLGRSWQCGTVQLDFVLPDRLDAAYHDEANGSSRPVILHHAVLGSLERFIGILLEHHDGHLPPWLAPEQVLVASINKEAAPYACKIEQALADAGLRVAFDDGPDTLPRKIVEARERGIPLIAVIGKREARERTVALRHRDGRQEILELAQAVARIAEAATGPVG
ncbi:MAG TPA: threonine--tRNA ligase [Aliidongia sp.]|uniref:threonine--tRNA ligase n=1 Tax=Aliidongia sp. TaxID=1914230 RepID=UPI002DDD4C27|nr:threonine--tRNA ligase [Aliidongia sp.]HEV2678574.1 threonine--tRNA ligase [Aliidongia sp.]